MKGYIYIMRNPSFNWIKIGFSRSPEKRRLSLSNSSVPFDYEIVDTFEVKNMAKAEREVFGALKEYRIKKEFFRCTIEMARMICSSVQCSVNSNLEVDIDIDYEFENMIINS